MRVSRNHNFHTAIFSHSQMNVFQIESSWRSVAFHDDSVLARSIQNSLHVISVRISLQYQSPGWMSDDLRVRVFNRRQNPVRHLSAIQIHIGMNGNEYDVKLRQNFAVQIQLSVLQNIHFTARKDADSQTRFVSRAYFFDLLESALFVQSVCDGHSLAVVRQRDVFVSKFLRRPSHLFDRIFPSLAVVCICMSPQMSFNSIKSGRRCSAAASISPVFSRSSGEM